MKGILLFTLFTSLKVGACCDMAKHDEQIEVTKVNDESRGKVFQIATPERIGEERLEHFSFWAEPFKDTNNAIASELNYIVENGKATAEIYASGTWHNLSVMAKYKGGKCPLVLTKTIE